MSRLLQASLAFLVWLQASGQSLPAPSYAEIDNNHRNYVNQLFGALEPNRVPTGLLMDYAFDFAEPRIYNGTVLHDSTLVEPGIFSELYKTIYTSRFRSSVAGMRHPEIHDSLWYIARQREVITLSGMLFSYNTILPNANTTGKMDYISGQLRDKYINGVWQNPYQEAKTLAISPSVITYKLTRCSVVLPSNLWLGNINSQISSMQFDAGDGQGYRSLQFGVPIQLAYTDTGWKRWVLRVTLTTGQQLYSHSKIHFNNTSNIAGTGGMQAQRGVPDRRVAITATEQFNGAFGAADIIISHRNVNDQVIRRPLIVAEGLDPGRILSPEEPEGQNDFEGFINSVRNSNSALLQNQITGDPFVFNSPSEYDIIYINWRNGMDWLQRNALVLEEVIRWVNRNKQPLGGVRQPNVVLGSSMGGVIARMALGRMDRRGGPAEHDTRLFVSLDAPQQGANVPLGYQAAARHAARMYLSTGPATVGLTELVQLIRNRFSPLRAVFLADQPAAQQLLVQRIDFNFGQVNFVHQQFMQELRTQWAYPVNIRNIAISNGSECAIDQEFAAGSTLIYHQRMTKTRFIGDLIFMAAGAGLTLLTNSPAPFLPFAIPGSNKFELTLDVRALANGGGNRVYYGNIKLTKKVLWIAPVSINVANRTYNAPTGLLPLDTYPGSFYTVRIANQPGAVSQDWMFTYDNTFSIQRRFAFIHTTSALDIGGGNTAIANAQYTARYIGATPPAPPFQTPFQNFTTAFNNQPVRVQGRNPAGQVFFEIVSNGSEPHEGFFVRNSGWLAEELNNGRPVTNCLFMCANSGTTITGPAQVCSNAEVYTANNPPAGIIGAWTAIPAGIVNITPSPDGRQATVSRTGTGSFTLRVTYNGGDCGILTVNSGTIRAGGFSSGDYPVSGPTAAGCNAYITYTTNTLPGATSYNWFWPSTWTYISGQGTTSLTLRTPSTQGSGMIGVRVANACDAGGSPGTRYTQVNCNGFMVSPNPATDEVSVQENENTTAAAAQKTTPAGITEVIIYDQRGNLLQRQKFSNVKRASLNVSRLNTGIYIIEISDGLRKERQQLSIRRN